MAQSVVTVVALCLSVQGAHAFTLPMPTNRLGSQASTGSGAAGTLQAKRGGGSMATADFLRRHLGSAVDATMLSSTLLAPGMKYVGPMTEVDDEVDGSVNGATAYASVAQRWSGDAVDLLPNFSTAVLRVAPVAADRTMGGNWTEVAVTWRATWSPESVAPLASLAQSLGLRIQRVEPDPYRATTFSARALGRFFWAVLRTGEVRLPLAVVDGRALLRFEATPTPTATATPTPTPTAAAAAAAAGQKEKEEGAGEAFPGWACVRQVETLGLLQDAAMGRLKSRAVAENLACFLDVCRRPDHVDPDTWAAAVRRRVITSTPGTGVMEVTPNEDDAEGLAVLAAFALLFTASLYMTTGLLGL